VAGRVWRGVFSLGTLPVPRGSDGADRPRRCRCDGRSLPCRRDLCRRPRLV